MCDFFWQRMENDQGDLTDIIRGGGHTAMASSSELSASDWPLPTDPTTFPPSSSSDNFGNPFPNFQDPLLNDFLNPPSEGSIIHSGGNGVLGQRLSGNEQNMKSSKPCNIMPRVGLVPMPPGGIKPSPLSPRAIRPYPVMAGGTVGPPSVEGVATMQQISSPPASSLKRRKNQAKKVICIPAPAITGGGRPTGEVVPSDLWAWRKYGQKPIKGSPYPRGYYRCSSSKGCSARKQVERSRTDPNMLVITYTSEHNHPWPTQRNALAGSTRSQLAKNNSSSSINKNLQNNQKQHRPQQQNEQNHQETPKEEPCKEITNNSSPNINPSIVKEEEMSDMDKSLDPPQDDEFGHELLMDRYKPMIPDSGQPDDFFADLQELEADPMSLIFSKEYMEAKPDQEEKGGSKCSVDPFNMLDWGVGGSSYGEAKKDL
ncbi:WRKY DNA-binding protein 35 [Rhynchospora pubera]|uniref:WRKY DNA-binding protein 35 n=1 Tax=Rhynchospora pubera TaxID=906938 RepID=A0AAV8G834_9POAL|nr:WRKY DNA-binding protein 35 [Rhynchospora pubera]